MTAPLALDPARSALVLVDLMDRIVALPLEPRKGTEVLSAAEELTTAFRSAGATVVLVRVERPGIPEQPPGSGLVADLDARLRERGITTLVLGGMATNLGVESTARAAADLGYDLVFVEDAMAAFTTPEHEASVRLDFPRLGAVVRTTDLHFTP